MSFKVKVGYLLGVLASAFLVWLCYTHTSPALTGGLLVLCGLLGWITGIILSPKKSERSEFKGYREAIVVFIAGFASAKVGQFVDVDKIKLLLTTEQFQIQLIVAFGAFLIGLLFTFIGRRTELEGNKSAANP